MRAARELFTARGFAATSVSEIAAAAGVADGTVYTYFQNKRDLLYAVIAGLYDPLTERVRDGIAAARGFTEALEAVIRHHLEALVGDPDLCLLMLQEVRTDPGYDRSAFSELNRRYVALLIDLVERAQARGEVRADLPPRLARDILYGAMEHVVWNALTRRRPIDVAATTRQLMNALLPGFLAAEHLPAAPDGTVRRLEQVARQLERALSGTARRRHKNEA